jgi:Protein of unknown function (DUF3237)
MPTHPTVSRRRFTKLSAAAAGAVALRADALEAQSAPTADDKLQSEFLVDLVLDTQPANNIGSLGVNRVVVPVSGGTFDGPRLKGTVIGPGGDWIVRRPDGSSVLDVRILLQTDDNQKIYVTYRGISFTPQGGAQYWRIVPVFETGAEKYLWLNNIIAVGVHRALPGKVAYRVYQIL